MMKKQFTFYDFIIKEDSIWQVLPLHFGECLFRDGKDVRIQTAIIVLVVPVSENDILTVD